MDSVIPTIARLGLGFGIICHFPIAYFAVRRNLHQLLDVYKRQGEHTRATIVGSMDVRKSDKNDN